MLAVAVCKGATAVSRLLGHGGSSKPGELALKLVPDILEKIHLPETVIAVTGSNGKTSTVEMITSVLRSAGKKTAWNKEGSNQIEGVATFLLNKCTFSGRVKAQVAVIETDERYARLTFQYFRPTHYLIMNLYRDQLTRNGHPEDVYKAIRDSIYPESQLILNADEPLVSKLGVERGQKNVLYYGASFSEDMGSVNPGIYDDAAFCPVCGKRMSNGSQQGHPGMYHCDACGFARPNTQWTMTGMDLCTNRLSINGTCRIRLELGNTAQCYNTLAAFAVTSQVGIDPDTIVNTLNDFHSHMERAVQYQLSNNSGTALISKHENSVSYDQSIQVIRDDQRDCQVMIIVDAISRKYNTSDTSWLWDIDFEELNLPHVKRIFLSGTYCHDLTVRMRLAGIPREKIIVIESIQEAVRQMDLVHEETSYVMTCFSDIQKFKTLSHVRVVSGECT
ncbi:MAG: DUF1727 domain-containing protein [Firmicutes bacterium]|nr:DUF1727 domain-containing protein [Bacillota bacterium]